MNKVYKVAVFESERGWGSKLDEYMFFIEKKDAESFIIEFNSKNKEDKVPDWYMYADSVIIETMLNDDLYEKLKKEKKLWERNLFSK